MIEHAALPTQIEAWTREAVEKWGDDWPRISAYLETRLFALDPEERRALNAEARLTLSNAEDSPSH